jgi:carbon monoxide dehydrogenase subunit G
VRRAARGRLVAGETAPRTALSVVTASTEIAVTPERVWQMVMDPSQLDKWVTIHRRLLHADEPPPRVGFRMDQQIHLRGVNIQVHWTLVDCCEPERAVWEGRGPARSQAHTEYSLKPAGRGTRFDYRSEFRAPLGPFGAVVGRALVGGITEREATRTLERLRSYLEKSSLQETSVR